VVSAKSLVLVWLLSARVFLGLGSSPAFKNSVNSLSKHFIIICSSQSVSKTFHLFLWQRREGRVCSLAESMPQDMMGQTFFPRTPSTQQHLKKVYASFALCMFVAAAGAYVHVVTRFIQVSLFVCLFVCFFLSFFLSFIHSFIQVFLCQQHRL